VDSVLIVILKMYEDAMRGVHAHLISRTQSNMTYTSELVPENKPGGEVYAVSRPRFQRFVTNSVIRSWLLAPKQDHLVCFFPGLLMLGAVRTAPVESVSAPPRFHDLSEHGRNDWLTGVRLLETCVKTHDTQT